MRSIDGLREETTIGTTQRPPLLTAVNGQPCTIILQAPGQQHTRMHPVGSIDRMTLTHPTRSAITCTRDTHLGQQTSDTAVNTGQVFALCAAAHFPSREWQTRKPTWAPIGATHSVGACNKHRQHTVLPTVCVAAPMRILNGAPTINTNDICCVFTSSTHQCTLPERTYILMHTGPTSTLNNT